MTYTWRVHFDDRERGVAHLWADQPGKPQALCNAMRRTTRFSDVPITIRCYRCRTMEERGERESQETML